MTRQVLRRHALVGASALLLSVFVFGVSLSAQLGRSGARGVTVYADPDFRGESATFRSDTPNLRQYALNDKISSIDVPDGETWEACQDVNYGNRCQVFSGSFSNLRDMGWNDRISSLRRISNRGGFGGRQIPGGVFSPRGSQSSRDSQSLVFYDRSGFRGSPTVVTSAATNMRSINGNTGSVEVRGGTWQLCDRSGRCATVTRDVADLSQLGLRGRIDSARLVDNGRNSSFGTRRP